MVSVQKIQNYHYHVTPVTFCIISMFYYVPPQPSSRFLIHSIMSPVIYIIYSISRVSDDCNGLFVSPTCSMGHDTPVCYLLVLSNTGTCFSQSGTFSSRRHPINLGINSPCLRCHGNADRMAIALSFPFCPSERKHPRCMLPGRPPRIGTLALAKIYTDHSICKSRTDNKTWPNKEQCQQHWKGSHRLSRWSSATVSEIKDVHTAEALQRTQEHRITFRTTFSLSVSIWW